MESGGGSSGWTTVMRGGRFADLRNGRADRPLSADIEFKTPVTNIVDNIKVKKRFVDASDDTLAGLTCNIFCLFIDIFGAIFHFLNIFIV